MKKLTLLTIMFVSVACLHLGCKETPPGPPPPTGPDTTSHIFSWQTDTIGIFQSLLKDVWGTDQNNVYAVGTVYLPNRTLPTNIMRWNGTEWLPIDFIEGDLLGIHGFGANDIWVVGLWGIDFNNYALIGHWDGSSWHRWKFQQYSHLTSVWGTSSSNLFACGGNGLVLHFDGANWTKIETGTNHDLRGIWGVGNQIYVVGGTTTNGIGVLLKYTSGGWTKIYERTYRSDSLSSSQSAVWAEKQERFYIAEYVGHDSQWARTAVPNDNTYIMKTRGYRENDIFMMGSFGLLTHFNGSSWYRYPEFYKKPLGDLLVSAWCEGTNVFVVGRTTGARAIAYRGRR